MIGSEWSASRNNDDSQSVESLAAPKKELKEQTTGELTVRRRIPNKCPQINLDSEKIPKRELRP